MQCSTFFLTCPLRERAPHARCTTSQLVFRCMQVSPRSCTPSDKGTPLFYVPNFPTQVKRFFVLPLLVLYYSLCISYFVSACIRTFPSRQNFVPRVSNVEKFQDEEALTSVLVSIIVTEIQVRNSSPAAVLEIRVNNGHTKSFARNKCQ